jgi:thymidylate kinase
VNVILEGPDGGGKSTLAEYLANQLDLRIQQGSGPPKHPGEIEERLRAYLDMDGVIFDRHPAISDPIYNVLRGTRESPEFKAMMTEFYGQPSLIIYCRSTNAARHKVKEGEHPEHIKMLTEKYERLVQVYDQWALERAHLMYRIGDDRSALTDVVRVLAC